MHRNAGARVRHLRDPTGCLCLWCRFDGRLALCSVGPDDEEILKQFNIKSFPSLLVMAGTKEMGDGTHQIQMQQYPGKKYQFKPIKKFLRCAATVPPKQQLPTHCAARRAFARGGGGGLYISSVSQTSQPAACTGVRPFWPLLTCSVGPSAASLRRSSSSRSSTPRQSSRRAAACRCDAGSSLARLWSRHHL